MLRVSTGEIDNLERQRGGRTDRLDRQAVRLAKPCSQGLVPADDFVERGREGLHRQVAFQPQRSGDVVTVAALRQTIQEPFPLLSERERWRHSTAARSQRQVRR